jgi:hypothetical protein
LGGGANAVPPAPKDDGPRFALAEHQEVAVVPPECSRQLLNDAVLAKADLSSLSCCSDCHHANAGVIPKSATALVSQSCQLCHKD